MSTKYRTTPFEISKMPPGIPYIVGNEAAERFSYYGVIAMLAVFLTKYLRNEAGELAPLSEARANEWQHNFMAAVYFFPFIGAIVSDVWLGKYNTIISVSLLYCAGHAILALVDIPQLLGVEPRVLLMIGLTLLAVGAGGIKPCVSAHVGDQFSRTNKHLIAKAFAWFYFAINLGSTVSMPLTPWLLSNYGPAWAFGVPGIAMGIATLVFWLGRHKFVHIPPAGKGFLREMFSGDGLRAVGNLIPLFIFTILFWCLFDQTHSKWVHQAQKMYLAGFDADSFPAQLQTANAIMVMAFIPLFNYVLYPAVGRFVEVTPLRKIGVGLFLTGMSFVIASLIQERIDAGGAPHFMWQVLAYAVITAGEVLVSITGLEFSYTQAPRKMKSMIMGVFFLSITAGNLLTSQVNKYIADQKLEGRAVLEGADYYWFFTGVMFVMAVGFVIWSQFYRGKTYIQGEGSEQATEK